MSTAEIKDEVPDLSAVIGKCLIQENIVIDTPREKTIQTTVSAAEIKDEVLDLLEDESSSSL